MLIRIIFLLVLIGANPGLNAAEKTDPGLEDFKNRLVHIYLAPDTARIRSLLHPKSLSCLNSEPKYEHYLMRAETMQAVPSDAKVTLENISADAKLPYKGFEFPVRPTHSVRMEYGGKQSPDGRSSITLIAEKYIAPDKGKWYLLMPCPTPEGMARLNEMGLLD